MVRHAPIHRRSGHSDIAICCGRNVRGSSPSTSVVPLSNQVTTLNHKRFKGFKMFSDGHLGPVASDLPDFVIQPNNAGDANRYENEEHKIRTAGLPLYHLGPKEHDNRSHDHDTG